MDLIATYVPDTSSPDGYRIAWLLPDARTSFGKPRLVASPEMLIRVLVKMGADEAELRQHLRFWGQGNAHVRPNAAQVQWIKG